MYIFEYEMKFPIYLTSVFILSSSWGNSLVLTKLDMNSFINYYQKEITKHNVDTIKELFSTNDLFKYCDRLREANIYQGVTTSEEFSQSPSVVRIYFPNESIEVERDQVQMQLFNFRLGHSKHTVAFYGFQCMNYERNMSWIVSPAFVPDSAVLDSAFLFEFELNFRQLSQREIRGGTEVIARSVAFVDQGGNVSYENILRILLKFKREFNEKDPLCDLDPVLKHRLCSIALDSKDGFFPLARPNPSVNNSTTRGYVVREFRQYFNLENDDDECESLNISFLIGPTERSSAKRKMLLCSVNRSKYAQKSEFHIGLDPFDPTRIICSHRSENVLSNQKHTMVYCLKIPLFTHFDVNQYIQRKNN